LRGCFGIDGSGYTPLAPVFPLRFHLQPHLQASHRFDFQVEHETDKRKPDKMISFLAFFGFDYFAIYRDIRFYLQCFRMDFNMVFPIHSILSASLRIMSLIRETFL
jgi:hypothetical protein